MLPWLKMSKKQNDNGTRFALVPRPGCTCEMCLMQASRGFVFRREFNPHGGRNMSCKCKFVAGNETTKIEGYDPEEYKKQYENIKGIREGLHLSQEQISTMFNEMDYFDLSSINVSETIANWNTCAATCGADDFAAVLNELKTRTATWAFEGEVPKLRFLSDEQEAIIKKDRPHELTTAHNLAKYGFMCEFKDDFKASDLVGGIELCSLIKAQTIGAIDRALRHAGKKGDLKVCVIDNSWGRLSDSEVIKTINEKMLKREVVNVLYITSEGLIKRISA